MSGTRLDNENYAVVDNWINGTKCSPLEKLGLYCADWTNKDNLLEPALVADSAFDIDGRIAVFDSNESPTGTAQVGTCYIRCRQCISTL